MTRHILLVSRGYNYIIFLLLRLDIIPIKCVN